MMIVDVSFFWQQDAIGCRTWAAPAGFQGPSKHERPLSSGQHPSFSIFRLVDRILSRGLWSPVYGGFLSRTPIHFRIDEIMASHPADEQFLAGELVDIPWCSHTNRQVSDEFLPSRLRNQPSSEEVPPAWPKPQFFFAPSLDSGPWK